MNDLDVTSIFLGALAVLPLFLLAYMLISWLDRRRIPKFRVWQKTGHLR
jgi:hypothetical protein